MRDPTGWEYWWQAPPYAHARSGVVGRRSGSRESRHDARWLAFLVTCRRKVLFVSFPPLCPFLLFPLRFSDDSWDPRSVGCWHVATSSPCTSLPLSLLLSLPLSLFLSFAWHVIFTFVFVLLRSRVVVSLVCAVSYRGWIFLCCSSFKTRAIGIYLFPGLFVFLIFFPPIRIKSSYLYLRSSEILW